MFVKERMAELKAAGVHAEGDERNPLFTLAAQQWKQLPEGERQERVAKHKAGGATVFLGERTGLCILPWVALTAQPAVTSGTRLPNHMRSPPTYLQTQHDRCRATCTRWIITVGHQGSVEVFWVVGRVDCIPHRAAQLLTAGRLPHHHAWLACQATLLCTALPHPADQPALQQQPQEVIFSPLLPSAPPAACSTHPLPRRSLPQCRCPI